ncbi:MAG: hypothetical protein WCO56_03220 [Verrucomicrobiota bacterium]
MKSIPWLLFIAMMAAVVTACQSSKPVPISKDVAAVKITEFVNNQLRNLSYTSHGMYSREENGKRPYPVLSPTYWRTVTNIDKRWVASHLALGGVYRTVDDGLFIRASVDQFGLNPRIEECKCSNGIRCARRPFGLNPRIEECKWLEP